ncbi:transcriptional regulator [Lentilactobacillus fungorum]|uniref:Transcriptional regulator n=1 Tax=Lentilactobacillus fungorum TaxID=2201250 RepID=A0ABQ3VZ15_9LACO|nr:TetR/AcrR family transcriptional regulator [Lentilactobacillus fungorum]GHP14133.1 transcriptional regulator [Lentilactobacillus fungorum]
MVSTTFLNLNHEKQLKIQEALVNEFSTHPLAEAQVAPIVKEAGIARGAFYKYFDDLTDAYHYMYGVAMKNIHMAITQEVRDGKFVPTFYLDQVKAFVDGVMNSRYRKLIEMHLTRNESLVGDQGGSQASKLSSREWAAMILSHEVIKQILIQPNDQAMILHKFSEALNLLAGKGHN